MNMLPKEWQESIKKCRIALDLEREPVGVKFYANEQDFKAAEAILPTGKMNYCQAVAAASYGHSIKLNNEHFRCTSGPRVLGINPTDMLNANGENWCRLGLYCNAEVSRTVRNILNYMEHRPYGVELQPIGKLNDVPDVVIMVAPPYQMMRILQGYAYKHGMPKNIRMIGNQALCLECTAQPYQTHDINFSLLCIGTRHRSNWKDGEMAAGIPGAQFCDVIDGVWNTLNIMESDANKQLIAEKARHDAQKIDIKYQYNYYMDC